MSFPDGFTWGATMSARAAWGVASGSDVAAGTSGPTASLGWPASAPLDAEQLAGLGTEAVRLTIDWALIEPEPGRIDEGATERVREAAVALQHAGLDVWGCLHDGPLPGWFSVDEHGFGDERARRYFWPRFVETAGEDSEQADVLELVRDDFAKIGFIIHTRPAEREVLRNRIFSGEALMTIWYGIENGIPTADMSPKEFAPTNQYDQPQWPMWGQYYETKGEAGEAPDDPAAARLLELFHDWQLASDTSGRADVWREMLDLYAEQCYTVGLIANVQQPIAVRTTLRNVPVTATYNWQPQGQIGIYRPDTFWYAD